MNFISFISTLSTKDKGELSLFWVIENELP